MPFDTSYEDDDYRPEPERWHPGPGTALGRALYVIRLRVKPLAVSRRVGSMRLLGCATVADRARMQARTMAELRHPPTGSRWQPPWGRESPRADWMSWRERYDAFRRPGDIRFKLWHIGSDALRWNRDPTDRQCLYVKRPRYGP